MFIGSVQIASTSFCFARLIASINESKEYFPDFLETFEGLISKVPFVSNKLKLEGISKLNNFEALKSLQKRLQEIKKLDPNSFEYNTAIQQITAQEQGEAASMLCVFHGCWIKEHYPLLWCWIGILTSTVIVIISLLGLFIWDPAS